MNVRRERIVATYQPETWPQGILTGYDDGQGGFSLEHMVAFDRRPHTLLAMLREGIQTAWSLDFQYITFFVPKAFPVARQLELLGLHLGFEEYGHDDRHHHFVLHRPADARPRSRECADAVPPLPPDMDREGGALLHDRARDSGGRP